MRVIAARPPLTPEEQNVRERRKRGRHFRIVKVRENDKQLAMIKPPAGITFSKLNPFESKCGFEDGSIVIVYGNMVNGNDFEKRDLGDIDDFIADYLTVIEDNPKGVNYDGANKYETTRNTEYTKQFGFNKRTIQLLDEELRAINKEKEERNLKLKAAPFNSEDVEDKLETNELLMVEI